jgi:hypothetical protein
MAEAKHVTGGLGKDSVIGVQKRAESRGRTVCAARAQGLSGKSWPSEIMGRGLSMLYPIYD